MIQDEVVPQSKKYKYQKTDKEYKISVQLIAETSLDQKILNGLSEEERIEAVIELRSIHLQWLNIKKIQNLQVFTNLNVLYLQHNKITSIQNLECLKNLEYLAINDNFLTKISNIKTLRKLVGLNCNNNQIEQIEPQQLPKSIQLLSFKNNPVALDANYKYDLIKALPALEMLDESNITPEERFKCVGKFPEHLLEYAANIKHFRTKRQIQKKLAEENKPLYLGGNVDQNQAVRQVRQKTRKYMHVHQQAHKNGMKDQEENFEQKIQISRKIRDHKEETKMKMSQIIQTKQQDQEN